MTKAEADVYVAQYQGRKGETVSLSIDGAAARAVRIVSVDQMGLVLTIDAHDEFVPYSRLSE